MRGLRIRTRIFLLAASVGVLGLGALTLLSARRALNGARAGLRLDMERTAGLLVRSGFLGSPNILEEVQRFLDAEVLSFDSQGAILASSLPPQEARKMASELDSAGLLQSRKTEVLELTLRGSPRTAGIIALEPGHGAQRLALIYDGHILSERVSAELQTLFLSALAVAVLAILGATLVSRSVVKPLERLASKARALARAQTASERAAIDWRAGLSQGPRDEVETLAEALATMVDELQRFEQRLAQNEKLAALGRFSGALAHELRNPLASIRLILELELEALPEDSSLRGPLSMVHEEIERLNASTSKLLAFVRGPSISTRPTRARELIEAVVCLLSRQLDHLSIQVRLELGEERELELDPDALRHVLINLILNAAQAMPEGGEVLIRERLEASANALSEDLNDSGAWVPGAWILEVCDRGKGIDPADAEAVFEPFFTRREGGTGLGLPLSRAIARAHGGELSHEPRVGGGTILRLRLPLQGSLVAIGAGA